MAHVDGRKFSRAAQAERRRLGVELFASGRLSALEISETLGISQETVWRWVREVGKRGPEMFEASEVRGHNPRKMSDGDIAWIGEVIAGKTPADFGYEGPLWTLRTMQQVLADHRKIEVPISTLQRSLHRAGVVPRTPLRRARERRDSEVDRWEQETWPTVSQAAAEGAPVFFIDEAQFRADAPVAKTWSKKGVRPVVRVTGKRPRVNAISAITWSGDLLFDLYCGSFNAELFCAFLLRLDAFSGREFIAVVDGLRVHHCKVVREFIAAKGIRVRLVQLPAYAPDLNPDEHVWSYLKGHRMKRAPLREGESIDDLARGEMLDLAKDRDRVRSFFGHPAVRYLHHDAASGRNCGLN